MTLVHVSLSSFPHNISSQVLFYKPDIRAAGLRWGHTSAACPASATPFVFIDVSLLKKLLLLEKKFWFLFLQGVWVCVFGGDGQLIMRSLWIYSISD